MDHPMRRELIPVQTNLNEDYVSEMTKIRILQYNVLAQSLMNRKTGYPYIKKTHAKWKFRKSNLLKEVACAKADIICFQEIDFYDTFWKKALKSLGYNCLYQRNYNQEKKKEQPWGILIAFKKDSFEVENYEVLDFHSLKGSADVCLLEKLELSMSTNFAQVVKLKLKKGKTAKKKNSLIVTNTHFYWRPGYDWIRFLHWITIHDKVNEFLSSEQQGTCFVAMVGDFNISPNDMPYVINTHHRDLRDMSKYLRIFCINEYCFEHFESVFADMNKDDIVNLRAERDKRIEHTITKFIKEYPVLTSCYGKYCLLDTDIKRDKRFFDEPPYTNFRDCYVSTLDYIFVLESQVELGEVVISKILKIPEIKVVKKETALPNSVFSSDHVCILAELLVRTK